MRLARLNTQRYSLITNTLFAIRNDETPGSARY
jgi:hypothetical protein